MPARRAARATDRLRHPFRELERFPRAGAGGRHWRVVGAEHAAEPWWFGNRGDNRFDLHREGDAGTCYLADDPFGALLETVFRDAEPTGDPAVLPPVAPAEVAGKRMCEIEVDREPSCADVTGRGDPPPDLHTGFGITELIGGSRSYERPQQWAQAWYERGFAGVRYRLAHGNGRLATALFGPRGAGPGAPLRAFEITAEAAAGWAGFPAVATVGPSAALTVHADVDPALHRPLDA